MKEVLIRSVFAVSLGVASAILFISPNTLLAAGWQQEQALEAQSGSGENCTFRADPEEFQARQSSAREQAYEQTLRFSSSLPAQRGRSVAPQSIPRRNFIDDIVFNRLASAGMMSAPISGDAEFLRRVTLDLNGRLPSPAEIRAFVADQDPDKRNLVINRLLYSPEFVDKWTVWLGDLLGNARVNSNRNLEFGGRNAMYWWMRDALSNQTSFRDIAYYAVAGGGTNFDVNDGATNFVVRSFHPMGPVQDTYDMLLVRTATAFLGLGHYDCLLCHDGRRHLDTISAWGTAAKRAEAQKMAAFFSRVAMNRYPSADTTNFYFNSYQVIDAASGQYNLNTTSGNRPNRTAATDAAGRPVTSYTPVYRDGKAPSGTGTWREEFVQNMIGDPLFAMNFANRLWKAMFNLGLVEPVDGLDPARLDPANPPPAPWSLQASHPDLLKELAVMARSQDFNIREFLRQIAESSAYQLSSAYDGEWDITRVSTFARRIPRRLEGEEVHDAILSATGTKVPNGGYTITNWGDARVERAIQLPEPVEPISNGTVAAFLNTFNRGNRDTVPRSQNASILLALNMMNNAFVTERIRLTGTLASPFLLEMSRNADNEKVVEEMFLAFLSRQPSSYEKGAALKPLAAARTMAARNTAIEDLAWSLVNKVDFLFSR